MVLMCVSLAWMLLSAMKEISTLLLVHASVHPCMWVFVANGCAPYTA